MDQTTVSLSSPVAQPPGDAALIEARARWNPDLSPAKAQPLVRAIEQADAQTLPGLLAQMELLCSVLDAETDPEPELSQRLASKVRVTLQHLVAASAAQAVDPHIEWEREAAALRAQARAPATLRCNDADATIDTLTDRIWALEERIAATPAATPGGIAAQIRLAIVGIEEGMGDTEEQALRSAEAALQRLAGRTSA